MNDLKRMELYQEAFAILERIDNILDDMHEQNLCDLAQRNSKAA